MNTNKNGKGRDPIKGYNPKQWYINFDKIVWDKKPKSNDTTRKNIKSKTI